MNPQITKSKIQDITRKIAKEFQPEKIILFGSHAWGTPGPDSDIDLFIIKDTKKRKIERAQEIHRILWGSKIPIDVLVYTPAEVERRLSLEDFFIEDVISKGKVLYST